MNVDVNIEAVKRASQIVQESQQLLQRNHAAFSRQADLALSQWQDVHVQKFIELYGTMSEDLRGIINNLASIDTFCGEVYNWIRAYSEM